MSLLSPLSELEEISTLVSDDHLIRTFAHVESALATAQESLGLVPSSAAQAIREVASEDITHFVNGKTLLPGMLRSANPVVDFVQKFTAMVAEKDSAAARYVHYGSTSQDILDTSLMLVTREVLTKTMGQTHELISRLRALANETKHIPTVARTLGGHGVPSTFGRKVTVWLTAVQTAAAVLDDVIGKLPVQFGGAAGTLSGYFETAAVAGLRRECVVETLRTEFARCCGLQAPVDNWQACAVPVAHISNAMCVLVLAQAKIAADVLVLSRTEIGEVRESTGARHGESSAMPHKENPALSSLIIGAARSVPGFHSTILHSLISEDERSAGSWHSQWEPLRHLLSITASTAHYSRALVEGLSINSAAVEENLALTKGAIDAERLQIRMQSTLGKEPAKTAIRDAIRRVNETEERSFGQERKERRPPSALERELSPTTGLDDSSDALENSTDAYTGHALFLAEHVLEHTP